MTTNKTERYTVRDGGFTARAERLLEALDVACRRPAEPRRRKVYVFRPDGTVAATVLT